jgi:hypothetical protein
MPAVEIADSIVQSGRETLEKAYALPHFHVFVYTHGGLGNWCHRIYKEMGRESGLWRYRFIVHLPTRKDEGASFPDRIRDFRHHYNNESIPDQTQI